MYACAAVYLLLFVSLHSILWSNGGPEMVDTVERLSKENTNPESPYSQAYSIVRQEDNHHIHLTKLCKSCDFYSTCHWNP